MGTISDTKLKEEEDDEGRVMSKGGFPTCSETSEGEEGGREGSVAGESTEEDGEEDDLRCNMSAFTDESGTMR